MRRKPGTSLVATIILMFSIVLFIGSIFYLVYLNPLNFSTEQSPNIVKTSYKEESPEPIIINNKSLEEAISELKHDGCTFVSVSAPVYLDDPQYLNYNDFHLKALETKMVVMSPKGSSIILLVQNEGVQWIWVP